MSETNGHTEQEPPDPGGIGGQPVVDERTGGKDMRLYRRAILEGWPIEPETRKLVVDSMSKIVKKAKENRSKIAASKVLVAADSLNARREANDDSLSLPPQKPAIQIGQLNVGALSDDQLVTLSNLLAIAGRQAAGGNGALPA